jgi:hypothetical protein
MRNRWHFLYAFTLLGKCASWGLAILRFGVMDCRLVVEGLDDEAASESHGR